MENEMNLETGKESYGSDINQELEKEINNLKQDVVEPYENNNGTNAKTKPADAEMTVDDRPTNDVNKPPADEIGSKERREQQDRRSTATDPYEYTRGPDFTSEIYKIEVFNLPNFVAYAQLKKLIENKLRLLPVKIKLVRQMPPRVFITFRCEVDRTEALNTIRNYNWKGKCLQVKRANPRPDPLVRKRKEEEDAANAPPDKRIKTEDVPEQSVAEMIKTAVTPLWDVPYAEQLEKKQAITKENLIKLANQMEKTDPTMAPWLKEQSDLYEGTCCTLLPIIPSPVVNSYRNKCEFNLGHHPQTGERMVGFRISSYKKGSKGVASPDDLPNLQPVMIKAAKAFEQFVRQSDKDIFNPERNRGYWRQLTVRTSGQNDLMLIVGMRTQDLEEEEVTEEMDKIRTYFEKGDGSHCGITSLYFQPMGRNASNQDFEPPTHLMGRKRNRETVLGLNFLISPNAFFQVNAQGAEVLYKTVGEFANVDDETALLDICCGTGSIGLTLASKVKQVVGIELCAEAVEDARRNATENGVKNIEFICQKAEEAIHGVIQRLPEEVENIVAIVDPPRAGLHNKVVRCIRSTDKVNRIVYVACNAQGAIRNFVDLCRPISNNYKGTPFRPVKAVAVDLFPFTLHCELVVLFERDPEAD